MLDTIKRCRYGLVSLQKVPYHTVSFHKVTLNDTNHFDVIIYKGVSMILKLTILVKIYRVIMQLSTIKVPYCFIDTDTVLYCLVFRGIHLYIGKCLHCKREYGLLHNGVVQVVPSTHTIIPLDHLSMGIIDI